MISDKFNRDRACAQWARAKTELVLHRFPLKHISRAFYLFSVRY